MITADHGIVAVGRPHLGTEVATYDGFAGGNLSASVPMLFKNMWGSYNSAFYVQNADEENAADITIKFYDADGNLSCQRSDTIPALATLGYWVPSVECQPVP